jgi:hypothetical protein
VLADDIGLDALTEKRLKKWVGRRQRDTRELRSGRSRKRGQKRKPSKAQRMKTRRRRCPYSACRSSASSARSASTFTLPWARSNLAQPTVSSTTMKASCRPFGRSSTRSIIERTLFMPDWLESPGITPTLPCRAQRTGVQRACGLSPGAEEMGVLMPSSPSKAHFVANGPLRATEEVSQLGSKQ